MTILTCHTSCFSAGWVFLCASLFCRGPLCTIDLKKRSTERTCRMWRMSHKTQIVAVILIFGIVLILLLNRITQNDKDLLRISSSQAFMRDLRSDQRNSKAHDLQKIHARKDAGDFVARDELEQTLRRLRDRVGLLEQQLKKEQDQRLFPKVQFLSDSERRRVLVTGGAGFVGSHLVDRLMELGHEVIALDNFFTGRRRSVEHWIGHPHFELVHHDVVNPFFIEVDEIYHLASPASPPHYMYNPVKTIKTNVVGTINMLGLARRVKARILLASTSEVYGDPEVSPQTEAYWGHVNPIGPRSCYDEGKRAAESLMVAYKKQEGVDIRIARIFNTFGPRMHLNDGRVVSNFIVQALQNLPITIYGDGTNTRCFQFVSDLVDGLVALMASNVTEPVNLGSPDEHTIEEFASIIKKITGSTSSFSYLKAAPDDPKQRRPDISRAKEYLDWEPKRELEHNRQRPLPELDAKPNELR